MDRLIYTSTFSIENQAFLRPQLIHELANISTIGFKKSLNVAEISVMAPPPGHESRIYPQMISERFYIDNVKLDSGPIMITGRNLDVSMNNNTLLGVQTEDGTLAFTRRGDLRVNSNGLLENGTKNIIMGTSGPITVPAGFNISIRPDGVIMATDPAQPTNESAQEVGRLLLRDATGLDIARRKDGLFSLSAPASGVDVANNSNQVSVTPGALEGSNVNPIESMVRLMDQSRSFEQRIRIIKECKEIDESGAAMMRLNG